MPTLAYAIGSRVVAETIVWRPKDEAGAKNRTASSGYLQSLYDEPIIVGYFAVKLVIHILLLII